ncbi:MAG: FecR family protein, partial [Pedobacter sp.]
SYKSKKDLHQIIQNYVSGKATAEEIKFIETYYQQLDKENEVLADLSEADVKSFAEENFIAIKQQINADKAVKKKFPIYRLAAAAILLLAFGLGIFLSTNEKRPAILQSNVKNKIDVLPGVDKAILTLADGSKIILDQRNEGEISKSNGVTISKTTDGQIIYTVNPSVSNNSKALSYNTIETPKGGQYQVILPDGTKVWLNAASSLKYPSLFAANERKVELTGEAYFEVAKQKSHPFRVISKNQTVEVLGTHFNINAYGDDKAVKTTLLEGSVKISNPLFSKTLKPNEQAYINNYGLGAIAILPADADDETAWKNGEFRFNNASLKAVLYQLDRWYDLKIDYNHIPAKRYNGMVSRKAKLSEVL